MDLRVEKTRKSIVNAFIALRAKKPLEKITVKELCEYAMINKSTFYSHYADIYNLSDTLETEVVSSIIQTLEQPGYLFDNTERATKELFLAFLSQNHLIQILFSGSRSSSLIYKIEQQLKKIFFQKHPEYKNDLSKNIGISYAIYGTYYSFMEHQNYDQEQVIFLLGRISQYAADLLVHAPAHQENSSESADARLL